MKTIRAIDLGKLKRVSCRLDKSGFIGGVGYFFREGLIFLGAIQSLESGSNYLAYLQMKLYIPGAISGIMGWLGVGRFWMKSIPGEWECCQG